MSPYFLRLLDNGSLAVREGVVRGWHAAVGAIFVLALVAAEAAVPSTPVITTDDLASLLQRTKTVVLGDVVSLKALPHVLEYEVRVVETLKGTPSSTLILQLPRDPGEAADARDSSGLQDAGDAGPDEKAWHDSAYFWLGIGTPYLTDFGGWVHRTIHRGRYLIFLQEPFHAKAIEPIFRKDDPWYLTVKANIAAPELRGRSMEATEFLKLFPAVYLARCGRPESSAFQLGKIWGRDVTRFGDATKPNYFDPGPCEARKGESFLYLALYLDVDDFRTVAVPIHNGTIKFAAVYGDIVIPNRDLPLAYVMEELARTRERPK